MGKGTVWAIIVSLLMPITSYAEEWSKPEVSAPTTELVMELKVDIGAPINIGKSDHGNRRFIPITGGSFEGKGIKGEVVAGGADWQLTRQDGVTEIEAIYAIKTDDGQVIAVENWGLLAPVSGARPYVRTTPRFKAPEGNYDWLNKRVFTGTISPSPEGDFVLIRIFQIQ